jgi:hypothetical protein
MSDERLHFTITARDEMAVVVQDTLDRWAELTYRRVSAHRPDRMGTVVLGVLLPYDEEIGERVKDSDGVIWTVLAESIRGCSE